MNVFPDKLMKYERTLASVAQPKILVLASQALSLTNFRGEMIRTLIEMGCEVHAAAPEMPDETRDKLTAMNCVPHQISLQRTGLNPVRDLNSVWRLYRLMRKLKPDIAISYTIKPMVYGTLAAWLARVPKRVALVTGLGFSFVANETGINGLIMKMARQLIKHGLKCANLVLFQNPDDYELFRELKFITNQQTGIVNGSGVDVDHYCVAPLPEQPVFLLIARLLIEKGIREYISAAEIVRQQLPNSRFLLAGPLDTGPSALTEKELDEWIASGTIEYLGNLDDVRPVIGEASVYVLPSYREGTPRTVLEAMAMGRPVITSDAPGCRQPVTDGENGFLVPVKSVEKLAASMVALGTDAELRNKMGLAGRQIAEDRYDVRKVNASIIRYLEL